MTVELRPVPEHHVSAGPRLQWVARLSSEDDKQGSASTPQIELPGYTSLNLILYTYISFN